MKNYKFLGRLLAGSMVVVMLSGCDFWNSVKSKLGGGEKKETPAAAQSGSATTAVADTTPLLKINGEVELTKAEFDVYANQLLASNPYFKNVSLDQLPAPIKRKIFDSIVQQRLIVKKAKALHYQDKGEFKKSFDQTVKLVESTLLAQLYEKEILDGIKVSDDEVKGEFDANHEKYVKVSGGVLIEGVRFDNEQTANQFLAKAKANAQRFASFAKSEKKGEFKDFGRVSKDPRAMMSSGISPAVLEAAMGAKQVPGVLKVDDGGSKWVVHVSDKKDSVFFDFAEIKQQLELIVKRNKFMATLEERVKDLKNEFTVDIEENFFAAAPQPAQSSTYVDKDGQTVARVSADQLPIKKIETAAKAA